MQKKTKNKQKHNTMKKRKKINVVLPLCLMQKGDIMFISPDSWALILSKDPKIVWLYIHSNPLLSPVELPGYIAIKKIGDDCTSSDFELEFGDLNYFMIYPYEFDKSEWLEPVQLSVNFITPLNVDYLLDYSNLTLQELINVFESILDEINLDFSSNKIQKIFQALPKVVKNEYFWSDLETLYNEKSYIDETLEGLLYNSSKRDKLASEFYRNIKQIIVETIAIKQEKEHKNEHKLSVEELKKKIISSTGKDVDVYLDSYSKEITKKNKPKKGGG